jgi:carbon monoxide dehydrogenase subunit G
VHLEKQFYVDKPRDSAAKVVAQDETLLGLFPDAEVEIVESRGNQRTIVTRFTALGQPGSATFVFTFENSGDVSFEKQCDGGKIWKELKGAVTLTARGDGTRVIIAADGRTKAFVPEFAVRGAMQDQIDQMATALSVLIRAQA